MSSRRSQQPAQRSGGIPPQLMGTLMIVAIVAVAGFVALRMQPREETQEETVEERANPFEGMPAEEPPPRRSSSGGESGDASAENPFARSEPRAELGPGDPLELAREAERLSGLAGRAQEDGDLMEFRALGKQALALYESAIERAELMLSRGGTDAAHLRAPLERWKKQRLALHKMVR